MLHLFRTFIIGLVVGALARSIMPGTENMGIFVTALVGIAGSFIGDFIARMFSNRPDESLLHPVGIIMSVVGALICLWPFTEHAH